MKRDVIHIVFAADEHYVQHAVVAMVSILEHAQHPEKIVFHLLSEDISKEMEKKAKDTVERYRASFCYHKIEQEEAVDYYISGLLSRAIYYRLQISVLLPNTIEKVLYLDCDLIVQEDVECLWTMDMEGKPIGAVLDLGILASRASWAEKKKSLGLNDEDGYFNSGVLLIDLSLWRARGYSEELRHLAASHTYKHHDQDVLNVIFRKNWKELPLRWNVIPPVWQLFTKILRQRAYRSMAIEACDAIAILHYAGGYKPWEYERLEDFNEMYYDCLEKSAFSSVPMPQYDARRKKRSIRRQLFRIRLAKFKAWIFRNS